MAEDEIDDDNIPPGTYKVGWNAGTKTAAIFAGAAAIPGGMTNIGTFDHNEADDALGEPEADNHVMYHHVRDLLYKQSIQDMHTVSIVWGLNSVELGANFDLAVNAERQLNPVFSPAYASNQAVTYSSASPAKVTVTPTGMAKGIAAGSSIITATAADGRTDTVTITVP